MSKAAYRPEIDGLRAIAVVSVVLFHLGFTELGGGYVGVDVFFVISGYLITRLIRDDYRADRFSYVVFYVRRARRLFPALFVVLVATFAAALFILTPSDFEQFSESLVCTTVFVSNICFWWESGYFDTEAIYKPLLHTWSLSVEEQFYLVWPTVLTALLWIADRRAKAGELAPGKHGADHWIVPGFLLVAGALSIMAAEIWLPNDAAAVFFLAPFRIAEFAIGAALVWLERWTPKSQWQLDGLLALGLALILVAVFGYTEETPFPGLTAMVPCLGAGLVIYAGGARRLGIVLRNRIMVGIGLISYSLYLVHWPIISLFHYVAERPLDPVERVVALGASVAIATAMYFWVETPFRVRRPQGLALSNRQIGLMSAAMAVILIVPGSIAIVTNGFAWRSPEASADLVRQIKEADTERQVAIRSKDCHLKFSGPVPADIDARLDACNPLGARNVAVLGDSHAADVWLALNGRFDGYTFVQLTGAGCSAWNTNERCTTLRDYARDLVAANRDRFSAVILTSRMNAPKDVDKYVESLSELAGTFARDGVETIVVGPHPELKSAVLRLAEAYDGSSSLEDYIGRRINKSVFRVDAALKKKFAERGIAYVSAVDLLCPDGTCPLFDADGHVLYPDYGHWTVAGGRLFSERLKAHYGSLDRIVPTPGKD